MPIGVGIILVIELFPPPGCATTASDVINIEEIKFNNRKYFLFIILSITNYIYKLNL